MTMTTAEYPAGIPPRPYAELARQEGAAQEALREAGISYEGSPDGQPETYTEAVRRLAPHLQLDQIGALAAAGVEIATEQPKFTPIHRLVGRKMLFGIRQLAS